jgi:hypothetical protein
MLDERKYIKRQMVNLVITMVLIITPSLSVAANSLLGEWISVERSKGGLGAAKNYTQDGNVRATFGALVDFKYKIVGKKLTLSLPQVPKATDIVQTFQINGDKLTLTDDTGNKQELTRMPGAGNSGIIGKWTGDHYTGAKQILHFTKEQNCYLAVPMISADGTYTIMGDVLSESYKDKGSQHYKWAIQDGVLTLNDSQGKTEKYMRKK